MGSIQALILRIQRIFTMNSSIVLLIFIVSPIYGGIVIPTDNCEWREETWGVWNMCYGNEGATGSCGSGSGHECHNGQYVHGIYCCDLPGYLFTDCEEKTADWGVDIDCGQKPVGGECGSGTHHDCHGVAHMAKCCDGTYNDLPLVPVDDACYWKFTPNWGEKIYCNRKDEAMFGRCGSGEHKDCEGGNAVHGIKCC